MSGRKLVLILGVVVAVAVTVSVVTVQRRRGETAELQARIEDKLMRGEARQAVQLIDEAEPGLLDPEWAALHRGDGLVQQRAFKEAKAIADDLLVRDPRSVPALILRSRALDGDGLPDPAMAAMDQALQIKPHDADALAQRAMVWVSRKDNEHALADLNEAIAADPKHSQALKQRCVILYGMEKLLEAKKDCEAALLGMPTFHRDRSFTEYAVHEVLEDLEKQEDQQNAKFAPPAGAEEKKEAEE
jgi:tetratricopeptide (TPR) repeat protein